MSLLYFYFSSISCTTCFGQPCAHHQELTTAWCYRLVLVCAVAAGRKLCYELIHGRTNCQPVLTAFVQPRHIPTRGYNITQSSAPDDGHMVARNMCGATNRREITNTKVTSGWFFLSTLKTLNVYFYYPINTTTRILYVSFIRYCYTFRLKGIGSHKE